ncbi:MAG: hypothetical protein ING98_04080 [Rhodocyclaceae bacterium]|nr:hypothetical protein [Rhodocyclaceae bacterium]
MKELLQRRFGALLVCLSVPADVTACKECQVSSLRRLVKASDCMGVWSKAAGTRTPCSDAAPAGASAPEPSPVPEPAS